MSDDKDKRFIIPGDYEGRLIGDRQTNEAHIAFSRDEAKSMVYLLNGLHETSIRQQELLVKLNDFYNDVLPQIGNICIQDYAELNEIGMELTNLGYKRKM